MKFFSEDIVIGDFDSILLSSLKGNDFVFRFLASELLKLSYRNSSNLKNGPTISLDFSFNNKENFLIMFCYFVLSSLQVFLMQIP